MAVITATFFECGVRYERQTENAGQKKVTELYIVDAISFTEAEERITREMQPFVSGTFDVICSQPASNGSPSSTPASADGSSPSPTVAGVPRPRLRASRPKVWSPESPTSSSSSPTGSTARSSSR